MLYDPRSDNTVSVAFFEIFFTVLLVLVTLGILGFSALVITRLFKGQK